MEYLYETEKLCLWVDPLDGTKNFVSGNLDSVTTMIGITYNQRPIAGIICKPFIKNREKYVLQPSIYCSMLPIKEIFVLDCNETLTGKEQLTLLAKPKPFK